MPWVLDPAIIRPGRLDQLIYIPLPDLPSRIGVFKANLRKSPVAKDVDINFLAQLTEGMSGADLTEICQKAALACVRDSIAAESRLKAAMQMNPNQQQQNINFNPVNELTRKHFEEALKTARMSVVQYDMDKFEQFRKQYDPAFIKNQSNVTINWPNSNQSKSMKQDDMDDLYN